MLHPGGMARPQCGLRDGLRVHRRRRDPVLDYRCPGCRPVFNPWTGTARRGMHRRLPEVLLILRGFTQSVSTARLARELCCDRMKLLALRRRLQEDARLYYSCN